MNNKEELIKELERQCEIRHLPFKEVKYLVDEIIADRDTALVERVEGMKRSETLFGMISPTYPHWEEGFNQALDDILALIRGEDH